jgi:hypothetical protein
MGNVDEIAALSKQFGADFIVFVAPRFHHWNPREAPDNWEADAYALDEPYQYEYFRFFEEKAKRRDYPIVSLLPDFRTTDAYPLVFRNDPLERRWQCLRGREDRVPPRGV